MISATLPKTARDLLISISTRKDITEFKRRVLLDEAIERIKQQYPQYFKD